MFFNYLEGSNQANLDQNFIDQPQSQRRTRTPFTKEEDQQLLQLVQYFGVNDKNNWYFIASNIKGRTPRQCRERYQLFLSDDVRKKAKWTKEEDELLISKYKLYGPHWKQMEQYFNGRTSYNIKNRFISLNRRLNISCKNNDDGNQLTNKVESPSIFNNYSSKTNNNFTDIKLEISHESNDSKDNNSSVFDECDFEFDDVFPLFDGYEIYNLFE